MSLLATSLCQARQSGTETPAWRYRLGDGEVKTSPRAGADTQSSATAQRPQKEAKHTLPSDGWQGDKERLLNNGPKDLDTPRHKRSISLNLSLYSRTNSKWISI